MSNIIQWNRENSKLLSQSEVQLEFTISDPGNCAAAHSVLRNGIEIKVEIQPSENAFRYLDKQDLQPGTAYKYQIRLASVLNHIAVSNAVEILTGTYNDQLCLYFMFHFSFLKL